MVIGGDCLSGGWLELHVKIGEENHWKMDGHFITGSETTTNLMFEPEGEVLDLQ